MDGFEVKIRLALTEKDSKLKSQHIKQQRRKLHLSDFSGRVSLREIMRAVQPFGTVEEICYIPSDSNKQTSCFVIYREPFIADRLSKVEIELRPGETTRFEVAFSPKELQERGLRSYLSQLEKQRREMEVHEEWHGSAFGEVCYDGDRNFRFNRGERRRNFGGGESRKKEEMTHYHRGMREGAISQSRSRNERPHSFMSRGQEPSY
jgi:hypothetical protein